MIPYNIEDFIWNFDLTYDTSDIIRLILVTLLFSVFVFHVIAALKRDKYLPPGPYGIPVFGRLPWVRQKSIHSMYHSLADRYGDIFSLRLGNRLVVCISSPEILKEHLNKLDAIGRPDTPSNYLYGGYGIIRSEGDIWSTERQFLHSKLLTLGVKMWGKPKFEKRIADEVVAMLFEINKKPGKPQNPVRLLNRHIHNVICQLIMSFRFSDEDTRFKTLTRKMKQVKKLFSSIYIGEYLPYYMRTPGKKEILIKIKNTLDYINTFYEEHLINRARVLKPSSMDFAPFDLLDCFHQQLSTETDDDLLHEKATQAIQVMQDLFSAGTETTRTAIVWLIVMMLREKEVADKVRAELGNVVRRKCLVSVKYSLKLPYLEAVILETLRRTSVVPLGTAHVNRSEWKIGNYIIPSGTTIIPLINKINMNPAFFPEPEKFIPERFIVQGMLHTPDFFLPFGVGKRACLGEALANMELFLFFANLMNFYEFTLADGEELPSLEGSYDTVHMPQPFKVVFKKF